MAKIWDILFAQSGDKITIPEPVQAGGQVSVTQGWGPDYELPDTDPDYKPVGRDEMNGILNMITESVQQLQEQGAAEWSSDLAPYPKGAEVIHSGERWYNPVAGNSSEPGTGGATWVLSAVVPDASETVKGIAELATALEAQGFSDALRIITPATLAAAFQGSNQALSPTGRQRLPGGLLLQWGFSSVDITTETTTTVTFPITFTGGALFAAAFSRNTLPSTNQNVFMQEVFLTNSQFAFYNQAAPNSPSFTTNGYRYIAVGAV